MLVDLGLLGLDGASQSRDLGDRAIPLSGRLVEFGAPLIFQLKEAVPAERAFNQPRHKSANDAARK